MDNVEFCAMRPCNRQRPRNDDVAGVGEICGGDDTVQVSSLFCGRFDFA